LDLEGWYIYHPSRSGENPKMTSWTDRAATHFDATGCRTYTDQQLKQFFGLHLSELRAPQSLTYSDFIKTLLETGHLKQTIIKPITHPKKGGGATYKPIKLYIWKEAAPVDVALALRPKSYLSHSTAAEHHGLFTTNANLYVNKEQSAKPPSESTLSQAAIRRAFSNAPRMSNLIYGYKTKKIVLLGGENTGDYNVENAKSPHGTDIRVTSLERTLVDLAVRPSYAGGVNAVLTAYMRAKNRISLPKIVAVLKALNHLYPFHQAVGFYLSRSGLPPKATSALQDLGLDFDFYLTNQISNPELDRRWRIYFPRDLEQMGTAPSGRLNARRAKSKTASI
jgi:hypothetical protein